MGKCHVVICESLFSLTLKGCSLAVGHLYCVEKWRRYADGSTVNTKAFQHHLVNDSR